MDEPYRVLVVDDSAFMRKIITDLLHDDKSLLVIATAVNGKEALEQTKRLKPDAITMDIEMPEMDGLAAVEAIMRECPTPVVMLSSRTRVGAEATVKALELGALDFVAKPSGNVSLDLDRIKDEIVLKVKIAAQSNQRITRIKLTGQPEPDRLKVSLAPGLDSYPFSGLVPSRIVAIGTSTGGPRALQTILANLPGNIPAGVVITQHMPPGFTRSLAERLNNISQLHVTEARDGDELTAGRAFIAPGDRHMRVKRIGERFYIRLSDDPPIGGLRPSIDMMMESLADCAIPVLGVLLTGMGQDGVGGFKKIRAVQGFTIAEDESTCVIYGMPRAAVDNDCVDLVAPLHNIAQEIINHL